MRFVFAFSTLLLMTACAQSAKDRQEHASATMPVQSKCFTAAFADLQAGMPSVR